MPACSACPCSIAVSRQVILHERNLVLSQLVRNGIEVIEGEACFDGPNQITVSTFEPDDRERREPVRSERIQADFFFLAIGTRPAMPADVPFDERHVFTSDGLLKLHKLPKSMIVVGGGVIGTEYACMLSAVGVKVTLVESRPRHSSLADGVDGQ